MTWTDLDADFRLLVETHCTTKQLAVLKLQSMGMSTRQIARYLGISRSSVQSRIESARHSIARGKAAA